MQKFIDNLKHLPTTIVGAAGLVACLIQDPAVQAAAAVSPKVAHVVFTVSSVASGLMLIFGARGNPPPKIT